MATRGDSWFSQNGFSTETQPAVSGPTDLSGGSTPSSGANPWAAYDPRFQALYAQYGVTTPGAPGSGFTDVAYWNSVLNGAANGDWGYLSGRLGGDLAGNGPDVPKSGASPAGSASPQTAAGLVQQDPSYQFDVQQGLDALQKSAAAKGTLLTGGTLKDIVNYGQGMASNEYGNIFNRNFQLASLGENAAALQGNAGANYGNQSSNLLTGIGNAQAAGTIAQGNAYGNAFNNVGNLALLYGTGNFTNPSSSYSGVTPAQSSFWNSGNVGPVQ